MKRCYIATCFALVLGIWLGAKADRFFQVDRCLDLGGHIGNSGLCEGANQ